MTSLKLRRFVNERSTEVRTDPLESAIRTSVQNSPHPSSLGRRYFLREANKSPNSTSEANKVARAARRLSPRSPSPTIVRKVEERSSGGWKGKEQSAAIVLASL